jgi:ribonuclease HIII
MKDYAKYIAIVVRNAMEDFHCKHLSDEQMQELNPIIRNAIYTAIYAYEIHKQSDLSKHFVDYHFKSIPK